MANIVVLMMSTATEFVIINQFLKIINIMMTKDSYYTYLMRIKL